LPLTSVPTPSVLFPLENVTVPVAADGETEAVKINGCPEIEGLALEVSVMVVAALTVCIRVADDPR
jgi:hypothetical protein